MMTLKERSRIINEIAAQHGGKVWAELLVDLAKDPGHPLHAEFDWDDAAMAHNQRLVVARKLISSVTIQFKTHKTTVTAPSFVRDPARGHKEQGYVSLTVAKKQEADRRAVVQGYLDRIEANIKSGHAVALSLGLETEFMAGLRRIMDQLTTQVRKAA